MEREILKQILIKIYSNDSVKSILSGRMKPSYETMFDLNKEHKIPFEIWNDIKSYISNDTEVKEVAQV